MSQLSNKAMSYWSKRQQTTAIDSMLQEQGPRGQYESPLHDLIILMTHIQVPVQRRQRR